MPIDAVPMDTAEASIDMAFVSAAAPPTAAPAPSTARRYRKPRPIQFWGSITVISFMVLLCFVGPHILHLPESERVGLHRDTRRASSRSVTCSAPTSSGETSCPVAFGVARSRWRLESPRC